MLVILILAVSVLLQFMAAFFACRLIKITGKAYSWIFISAALFLMGFRRLITLSHLIFFPGSYTPDFFSEIVAVFLSFLMFLGVIKFRPFLMERKRTENEQIKNEQRLRRFYDSGMLGVIYWNMNGQIVDANDKFLEMVGYTRDDLVAGKIDWINMTPPEYRHLDVASTEELKTTGVNKIPFEKEYICKDGSRLPILLAGAMLDEERFNGVAFVVDITERKRAENTLRESEDKFKYVFDNSIIGKSITLPTGEVNVNKGLSEMLGYSQEELKNHRWQDITHPDDIESTQGALNPLLSGEKDSIRFVKRYIHKNGSIVWGDISTSLRRDNEGKPLYFMTAVNDITELKLAENALHESEQKFHEIVFNLDEGFYSVTLDGLLLEHNQAFKRILGFDETTELVGVRLPDFWQNPEERNKYLYELKAVGSVSNYQINAKTQNGKKIAVIASAHFVKDKDNHPLRIEGVFLDITDRIRAEESLKRYSVRLQNMHKIDKTILQTIDSPESIVQTVLLHIRSLLSCQRASIGIFDFEMKEVRIFASEVDGDTIVQIGKKLDEDAYGNLEILRQGKMEVVEDMSIVSSPPAVVKILELEGILSSINVPLHSDHGLYGALNIGWKNPRTITSEEVEIADEVAGQITIAIEQASLLKRTKRYAAELEDRILERTAELVKSKKLLEETGKLARVGGWEIDLITGKNYWSEITRVIHEVEPGFDPNLDTAINFYAPESIPIITSLVDRLISLGEPFDAELELITAKKNRIWVRALGQAYPENGKIVKIGGVFQDINERKHADQEREEVIKLLEHRSSLLEASNKELEAFTYSVSHDLRAPLRHINGYVELLNERFHDSLPEKGIHYLDTIADAARQMAALIDDLLQFSRTGRQEMRQAHTDMNTVLQEVLETIKRDIKERSIEWVVAEMPHVYGDQALLRLVWLNLLGNSVKFTRRKEKAIIEVGYSEDDMEYIFFVRDNGAGFDMQYATKLFGVFQRLHSSDEFEGTGIGLANVRRIILKHGGRTWAEAELDKGAVFYFSLLKNKENIQ